MKVYFVNSKNEDIEIGNCENENDVMEIISTFLDFKNYKTHYTRTWKDKDNVLWYDVGSHTEFFKAVE